MQPLSFTIWSGRIWSFAPPAGSDSLFRPVLSLVLRAAGNGIGALRFQHAKPREQYRAVKAASCLAVIAGLFVRSSLAQTNGTVVAWGEDYFGQTNVPVGLSQVIALAAGDSHELALRSDGIVVAWGNNYSGQTNVPSGLCNAVAIAAGGAHSLALKSDGSVIAWGYNEYGQTSVPAGLSNVAAVAAGEEHSLVLNSGGTVAAWGRNEWGQTSVPEGLSNVIAIAAQRWNNLALKADGAVAAWGGNYFGQTNVPRGLSNVVAIAVGGNHMLALKSDGTVVAWGYNRYGQTNVPPGLSNVVAVAAGLVHSLALKSDGTVVAWGYNGSGETDVPADMGPVAAIAANQGVNLGLRGGPVNILESPENQLAATGCSADFTVKAFGFQPLKYQWFFNDTNAIAGATNARLRLAHVQASHSGEYRVAVTNAFGAATSAPARLTVADMPPTIVTPPAGQAFWAGFTLDLSVETAGSLPMSYQWFFHGDVPLLGGTNSTLRLANIQPWQAGLYSVCVSNLSGLTTSAPARLSLVSSNTVPKASEQVLRAALASGMMPVRFACDGTVVLSNTLSIERDTVLDGSGHQIVISGNRSGRVFQVNTNVSLTLSNLTIADGVGDKGAGVCNSGGSVLLYRCSLVGNSAIGSDGASYSGDTGTNGCGGAVFNSGMLNAIDCSFVSNRVVGGAGAAAAWPSGAGGAGGDGNGGAIGNLGTLLMSGCLLANNSANGGAGASGSAAEYGLYPTSGGSGGAGGGGNGGALFNSGSASLVNNTFAMNLALGGQGGLGGSGSPPMSQSSWTGDGGPGGAGGSASSAICDVSGLCFLTNCTVASNWATPGIGGLGGPAGPWVYPYPAKLGQPGANGAGGQAASALATASTLLLNTLLAGNTASNCTGIVTDAGHNLSSDGSCAFTGTGSLNNTDPQLGPLANHSGPTLTMPIVPGSPAMDAGTATGAPSTDQRGRGRPRGPGVDIGAFEHQQAPFFASAGFQTSTQFQLNIGDLLPHRTFTLQASSDLLTWSDLTNSIAGSSGVCGLNDGSLSNRSVRFYRLKSLAP